MFCLIKCANNVKINNNYRPILDTSDRFKSLPHFFKNRYDIGQNNHNGLIKK